LAITAYNHGTSGMEQAKAQYGDYPTIFQRYKGRSFKFASRNFYSEFLAANQVAHSCAQYFGEIQFAPPSQTTQVRLEGYAALKDVIGHFGVDAETLQHLNPAVRPPVFKGLKHLPRGYRLNLPRNTAESSQQVAGGFPRELYQDDQKPSRFYMVQEGDTAGGIARMHGIDVGDLILANSLDDRATIFVNQNLRLPIKGERLEPAADMLAAAQSPAPQPIPSVSHPVLASVVPAAFDRSARNMAQGPGPDSRIALPGAEAPPNSEVISGSFQMEEVRRENGQPVGIIRVEVEETLGHYADWLKIETQELRRLNGLRFGDALHLHQTLKLPLARVSKAAFEEKRFDYHKRLQEDFFSAYRIEGLTTYQVNRGDNVWTLSNNRFNVPIWLLKQCNPAVDFNDLHLSQRLMIPVVEKTI
jgi:membrane-bound lytic murein transglycosylase D